LLPTGRHYALLSSGRFWCLFSSPWPSLSLPLACTAACTHTHPVPLACVFFRLGLAYCTWPLNLLCYLMNDLSDVAVDADNPRKGGALLVGVRARASALRTVVPWAVAAQLPFLIGFCYVWGTAATSCWFSLVVAVNWLYNYGPRLSSNYAPLDLFCPCGYMLVIPLSCALCNLPYPPTQAWIHTLFFVVRSQLWIESFDIETDTLSGRRTTAVVLGLINSQRALAIILVAELSFVYAHFHDWAIRSFSFCSLILLTLQARLEPAAAKPSRALINTTFAVLGLGGYGMLVQVWLNGTFSEGLT